MAKTAVSEGQCLLDICLQELGSTAAAFEMADANGIAVTDRLTPGQVLVVPAALLGQPDVVSYFAKRKQRINTGNVPIQAQPEPVTSKYFHPNFFNTKYFA